MAESIRINVTVYRDIFPELFQELKSISRGRGRSDRLKILATVGLDGGSNRSSVVAGNNAPVEVPEPPQAKAPKGVIAALAKFQSTN